VSSALNVTPAQHTLLVQLLQQLLPDTGVWAFGSRVNGKARPASDLDLVIFSRPEQKSRVFALQEALEESALPFRVDLLIWDEIPESFKTNIRQHYIELAEENDAVRALPHPTKPEYLTRML
jgi:predicted nucleotidyltransferase